MSKNVHPSFWTLLGAYMGYMWMWAFGHLRDAFSLRKTSQKGYAPLTLDFEDFYTRRMYRRARDGWNRPVCSMAGRTIDVMDRESLDYNETFQLKGTHTRCLNLASYNYLGFAENSGKTTESVIESLWKSGVSACSSRREMGTTPEVEALEERIARFLGKEAAMIVGMGYTTNSGTIPFLADKGTLLISDSINHASIVVGARNSGAKVRVFEHDNMQQLESLLRQSIAEGQPKTRRPWRRILLLVEGVYSMEGEICRLHEIVALKKKYKCSLYVDEAHSIGAIGKTGRGVCEFRGVDTRDVDVLMGTLTKSFGSIGGYIASSRAMIRHLKRTTWSSNYGVAMSSPCAVQSDLSLETLTESPEGKQKLAQLNENSNFFRSELVRMGFEVLGSVDSPVIPVLVYYASKIMCFTRELLKRGIAVVCVGFPAVPLAEGRVRFCISASHTREDLIGALREISELGDSLGIKYLKNASSGIRALTV